MKTQKIASALIIALASCNTALAAPKMYYYGGIAVAWDHMLGNRSESFIDFEEDNHIISNGQSLSNNKINGYGFFGLSFAFDNVPLFIGPEIQVGQGGMMNKINVTTYQDVLGTIIPRSPNPEFSRTFTSSLAIKVGSNFNTSYQVYVLGGIDISRFKYKYTWQSIDLNVNDITGNKIKNYSRWKTAPLIGMGIEKEVNKNVKVGLECRIALYNTIKISQVFAQDGLQETATSAIKPKLSSVLLKISYVL